MCSERRGKLLGGFAGNLLGFWGGRAAPVAVDEKGHGHGDDQQRKDLRGGQRSHHPGIGPLELDEEASQGIEDGVEEEDVSAF